MFDNNIKFTENELRDYLFNNYKENIFDLITGQKQSLVWDKEEFPPLRFFLKQIVEQKINSLLESLNSLVLTARELKLKKRGDSTTRTDLFGYSVDYGIVIIELKISKPAERQSFTELLAYANHFCSIFPNLRENTILSVLIAPLETRTVRDAFVQELLINNKNILALTPKIINQEVSLQIYYPDESYFQWYENYLLNDQFMSTVAISFPEIPGWIDVDAGSQKIPEHSKKALNTISSAVAARLESEGLHALVYASQKWGEISSFFRYPNTIYVAAMNPFSPYQENFKENKDFIKLILEQLDEEEKEFWIDGMEASFDSYLIKVVEEEFNFCFKNCDDEILCKEISCPDWYGTKISFFDSVWTHQLEIYLTGLLRLIYQNYILYVYDYGICDFYYGDNLPKYAYQTLRHFLAVWEILRSLGTDDMQDELFEDIPF